MYAPTMIAACVLAIAVSGCLGDDIETIPVFLDAYTMDTDDDGKNEVVLDMFFHDGTSGGIRVDASGTMTIDRATADGDYSKYAELPMEITSDSLRWKDTQQGLIYRYIVSSHHFDNGHRYQFTIDMTGDDGTPYHITKEVAYER